MVGKAQRTKNNVKASNSGRSAQLLANLPNTSFIGFSTLKDAALHTTPDIFDDTISPDFQIILKKMNKKDSVTKHKALHEFAELCNTSDIDTLKAILPLWPRLYSILSIDIENRVREATQYAHKCVLTRVKRNIAPHLKHLIGPWIVSQFDTYPPAASVAKTSFEDVFPPLKRAEVFSFCKEDLFNYIEDNLIVQTPQTMSNPKITDAVNMEMKYERVISSTLQAYAMFISKLPPDILQACIDDHKQNILSTAKFWKYQKHESNLIRSSWYLLVATFIEKYPQVFEEDLKKLAVAVFSNLNEKDCKVNSSVWDAALYCVLKYETELWKCISLEKLVIPNVCNTLENGFHGNASQIGPKLLPLLSKLPSNEDKAPNLFNIYEKILTSLLQNITATTLKNNAAIVMSSSEFDSMVKCLTECCRYILKTKNSIQEDFCKKIVLEYILPLYKISSAHVQLSLSIRYLYQLDLNAQIIDTMWDMLENKLVTHDDVDNLERELCLHASLVQCLWNPYSMRKSVGPMKVKFNDDEGAGEEEKNIGTTEALLDSPCEKFVSHFNTFVSKLLKQYLSLINTTNPDSGSSKKSYVLHICKLSSYLDSKVVYDLLPLPAAFNEWGLLIGSNMYELMCKYIIKLNLEKTESLEIIEQCSQDQTMSLFTWCLEHLDKYRNIVAPWLQDDKLGDTILSLVYHVICGSETQTQLFEKCFVSNKSEQAIEQNGTQIKSDDDSSDLDIIVNRTIAKKIFLQFIEVFRNFGDNASEDKVDYENCAHVITLFLKNANIRAEHRDVISELLVNLVIVIMDKSETQEMIRCWETALSCAQPTLSTRQEIYRTIHNICVESLLYLNTSKSDTHDTESTSPELLVDRSVTVLSKLMTDGIQWDTIYKPNEEIQTSYELWHVYSCTHGDYVCACSHSHTLEPTLEWNIHENSLVQNLHSHFHIYVKLVLNLLKLHPSEPENVNNFFLDYFIYRIFRQQYFVNTSSEEDALFSNLWKSFETQFVQFVSSLDVNGKYAYLLECEYLRDHITKTSQYDKGQVISSTKDLIQLVDNITPLKSSTTKDSFIKYVRDHSKDPLSSREDVAMVTSLVQVFTKLMRVANSEENEGDRQYVEAIIDAIRGEMMLCVTSHLVLYYTYITSPPANGDKCGQIFLAAQLLRCYEQIEVYCSRNGSSDFFVEWDSVFASDCKEVVANIWVWHASMDSKTLADILLLNILGCTLSNNPATFSTLDTVCPLLLSPSHSVQITAYHLMSRFKIDTYDVIAHTLTSAQTVVAAMLENFSLGDTCIVLSNTDSFTYTLGYLLTWWLIVQKCDLADSSVRVEVAMWLKQEGYISALMRDLLRLMPDSLVHCSECLNNVQHLFVSVPPLSVTEVWDSSKLGHLVCSVYYQVLRRFPALVRHWWNESSPSDATLVEKFTAKYVSPLLCSEELKTAAKFNQENMVIRVFPGTKEVVATYTLEEASMEITIALPSNHPLGVIRVDSSKNLFPNTQWIKQITMFLIHANGSICDGLSSWKSNMDKKFEGVEECYICFCILHSRNHELPRKSCRTCQKKFHSYCLFKWFTTSNKSTCPICRNLF